MMDPVNYTPEDALGAVFIDGDSQVNGWYLDRRSTRVHFNGGVISRDDGPACIYTNGSESWYQSGKLHRDNDLPSVTIVDEQKRVIRNAWHIEGKLHRTVDKPASIEYRYKDNEVDPSSRSLTYYIQDKISRVGAPAHEIYKKKDKPFYVEYLDAKFGGLHRANGPAIECKDRKFEAWYFCGVRHCENGGPALKEKGVDTYYISGKEVSKKEAVSLFSTGVSHLAQIRKNYLMESSQKTGVPIPLDVEADSEAERRAKAVDFVKAWKSKSKKF